MGQKQHSVKSSFLETDISSLRGKDDILYRCIDAKKQLLKNATLRRVEVPLAAMTTLRQYYLPDGRWRGVIHLGSHHNSIFARL